DQPEHPSQRNDHNRQRPDASLDSDQELPPPARGAMDGEQLHRGKQPHRCRGPELLPERRWLSDAGPQRSAAAGSEILQGRREAQQAVTGCARIDDRQREDTRRRNNMKCLYSVASIAVAAAFCASAVNAQIFDLSKYPDWAGQWRRVPDGGPPRYDPSKKNGLAQEAPLKPEYQKMLEASLKDQEAGGQGLDLTSKCIPTGSPRMTA